jgi:hypothetical protein
MKRIVILEKRLDGESNELIQHIHFDSYCYEKGAMFLNEKYLDYSQSVKSNLFIRTLTHVLSNKIVKKILIKLRIAKYHKFYAPNFQKSFHISKLTYVKGWYFRNSDTIDKNKQFYIEEFNKKLHKEVHFEKEHPLKIALHIRRDDYKFFLEGRYFLDDSQYIKALKNVLTDIKEPFKIFVFGNDPKLNRELYMSLGYDIYFSDGTIYQDYYRMSKCQLLIGPSSTFSIWAQYISNGVMKKIVIDKFNYDQVRINDAF